MLPFRSTSVPLPPILKFSNATATVLSMWSRNRANHLSKGRVTMHHLASEEGGGTAMSHAGIKIRHT